MERLKEHIRHIDKDRKGFLPRAEVYTILRGQKLPIDVILLESLLDVYVYFS